MQHLKNFLTSVLLIFAACNYPTAQEQAEKPVVDSQIIAVEEEKPAMESSPEGNTIKERFTPPNGFRRVELPSESFGSYLQNLPLKAPGTKVRYYDGRIKNRTGVYLAVVDMDIGKKDLQQCADAIMRLRGEYLLEVKAYNRIHFNFTNGFRAEYARWRNGERIRVRGNSVNWYQTEAESKSYQSFRKYMEAVFMYAGTLSLAKELKSVPLEDIQVGDVFIQGGSPGHAVIVVDMAVDSTSGKTKFILAQSYMPAQDIQVLQNPVTIAADPWYDLEAGKPLVTPEWTFETADLKRFD